MMYPRNSAALFRRMFALLSLGIVFVVLGRFERVAGASPEPDAQSAKEPEPVEVGNEIIGDQLVDYFDDKTFLMGIVVLIFGLLVIVVQAWVIRSNTANTSIGAQMRYMIVLTVIVASLFTVVTGLSSQSVAPAMGLFGTIVGYLLGAGREREKDSSLRSDASKGAQQQDGEE